MPSKTSFFNKTTFRKDLTRFFPLWGLYALCLLLGLVMLVDEEQKYWIANNFAKLPTSMAPINLVYALVAAAVLFGDLYNTRMCYGLHALPMSRGSWFASHVLSGILFSLVPTAVMAVVALPMLAGTPVTNAWQLSLYWFAITNLQYLFFFGLAVLCALCAGNWLGLAALYGLVNFGAFIITALVEAFYTPLLPGVVTPSDLTYFFFPMLNLVLHDLIVMNRVSTLDEKGIEHLSGSFTLGSTWGYLLALAVIGLVLLAAAYLLYRRRKLESAGDFLAIPKLAPVLAVAMALAGAAAVWIVMNSTGILNSQEDAMILLLAFAGLAVSWFAGQMLLNRSTQVFHLRQWAGLGILTVVIAVSLVLTKMDVLGIADWLPQPEDVKSVTYSFNAGDTVEDEAGIADMIQLHNLCLEEKLADEQLQEKYRVFYEEHPDEPYPYDYQQVSLTYHLNNGRTVQRRYYLLADGEGKDILKHYSGTLGAIFGMYREMSDVKTPEDLMGYVGKPEYISVGSSTVEDEYLTAETVRNLFGAIIADAEAGNMSQIYYYHPEKEFTNRYDETITINSFGMSVRLSEKFYFYTDIFLDCQNLLNWMESVGITEQMLMDHYYG